MYTYDLIYARFASGNWSALPNFIAKVWENCGIIFKEDVFIRWCEKVPFKNVSGAACVCVCLCVCMHVYVVLETTAGHGHQSPIFNS